jgi:hypothetical protein
MPCSACRIGQTVAREAGSGGRDDEALVLAVDAVGPDAEVILDEDVARERGQLLMEVPGSINCRLRDYQREGVRFLYRSRTARVPRHHCCV